MNVITRYYRVFARKAYSWELGNESQFTTPDGYDITYSFHDCSQESYEDDEAPTYIPDDHVFVGYCKTKVDVATVHWADQRVEAIKRQRGVLSKINQDLQAEADSLLALEHQQ